MRDVLSFHPTVHGRAVRLATGRTDLIERNDPMSSWSGHGLAFSARPVKPGQKICLEVRQTDWSRLPGTLRVGFTSQDPNTTWTISSLPSFVIPDLTDTGRCWAAPVGGGSQINVVLESSATRAVWDVDGSSRGVLVDGMDCSGPLWLVVDLYGPVTGLRLVPTGQ